MLGFENVNPQGFVLGFYRTLQMYGLCFYPQPLFSLAHLEELVNTNKHPHTITYPIVNTNKYICIYSFIYAAILNPFPKLSSLKGIDIFQRLYTVMLLPLLMILSSSVPISIGHYLICKISYLKMKKS